MNHDSPLEQLTFWGGRPLQKQTRIAFAGTARALFMYIEETHMQRISVLEANCCELRVFGQVVLGSARAIHSRANCSKLAKLKRNNRIISQRGAQPPALDDRHMQSAVAARFPVFCLFRLAMGVAVVVCKQEINDITWIESSNDVRLKWIIKLVSRQRRRQQHSRAMIHPAAQQKGLCSLSPIKQPAILYFWCCANEQNSQPSVSQAMVNPSDTHTHAPALPSRAEISLSCHNCAFHTLFADAYRVFQNSALCANFIFVAFFSFTFEWERCCGTEKWPPRLIAANLFACICAVRASAEDRPQSTTSLSLDTFCSFWRLRAWRCAHTKSFWRSK